MVKLFDNLGTNGINSLLIRPLSKEDITIITQAFSSIGWNKPNSLFKGYLKEVEAGKRLTWIAFVYDCFAGYITLK